MCKLKSPGTDRQNVYCFEQGNFKELVLVIAIYMIYQDSLSMLCRISSGEFNPQNPLKWGKGDVIITTKTTSSDSNKYLQETIENGFTLTIYNLSTSDVNEVYDCYYGFEIEPFNLTMRSDLLLQSSNESLKQTTSLEDGILNVRFILNNVFPVPSCSITFNGLDISNKFEHYISHVDIFYKVEYVLNYNVSTCGLLNITCLLQTEIIMQETTNFCQDMTKDDSSNPLIIIGIICGCLGCTFLALAGYFIWRKCIKNPPTDSSKTSCVCKYRKQFCSTGN